MRKEVDSAQSVVVSFRLLLGDVKEQELCDGAVGPRSRQRQRLRIAARFAGGVAHRGAVAPAQLGGAGARSTTAQRQRGFVRLGAESPSRPE